MEFKSINQIKDALKIDTDDIKEIRRLIRSKIKEVHPDSNAGTFKSPEDEEEYHKLQDAMDFLDGRDPAQNALVPANTIKDIVKEVLDAVLRNDDNSALQKEHREDQRDVITSRADLLLNQRIDLQVQSIRKMVRYPKITIGVLSTAMAGLWIFPKVISDHPILSHYIDPTNLLFNTVWFFLLFMLFSLWSIASIFERNRKRRKERLKNTIVQNELFIDFIKEEVKYNEFTRHQLVQYLTNKIFPVFPNTLFQFFESSESLDMELIDSLVTLIISRAEEGKVITRTNEATLDTKYEIDSEWRYNWKHQW